MRVEGRCLECRRDRRSDEAPCAGSRRPLGECIPQPSGRPGRLNRRPRNRPAPGEPAPTVPQPGDAGAPDHADVLGAEPERGRDVAARCEPALDPRAGDRVLRGDARRHQVAIGRVDRREPSVPSAPPGRRRPRHPRMNAPIRSGSQTGPARSLSIVSKAHPAPSRAPRPRSRAAGARTPPAASRTVGTARPPRPGPAGVSGCCDAASEVGICEGGGGGGVHALWRSTSSDLRSGAAPRCNDSSVADTRCRGPEETRGTRHPAPWRSSSSTWPTSRTP